MLKVLDLSFYLMGKALPASYSVCQQVSLFLKKNYVVTAHQNHLSKTVLMRGHNICFNVEIRKIIPKSSLLLLLSGALDVPIQLNGTTGV